MEKEEKPVNEMTVEELRKELEDARIQLDMRGSYCVRCGACGEAGCCSVSRCSYVESYQGDYDEMVQNYEALYQGIKVFRNYVARGSEEDGRAMNAWGDTHGHLVGFDDEAPKA